ncbi:allantoinase AllB [Jiangella alba]|uniref:allantoinase n=1 Tax=Jiangella alba TaxID=561176 RepID=A0A1H5HHS8_9ACTN|nr:allantoinase AllB [Jiangella alba]SEE27284.1 allantoinase [Jiangella alba]
MAAELDLVVRARRVVLGRAEVPAAVGIAGGRIAAVTTVDDAPPAARTVTLDDDEVLLPGLVDTHVHVNDPGRAEWEGFDTATRAAAAGGVTTIVDMPLNSVPPTTTVAALDVKRRAAEGRVWVDVGFWGGAVPGNRADLAALHRAGVFGFKCFLLDSGVEEFGHLGAEEFAAAMRECAELGALLLVHAEDGRFLDDSALDGVHYAGFLASRPDAAEQAAIELVIAQARTTGGRAHIVHLSAAGAVPALRDARAHVSAETCPHYLTFDAEHIADGATELKCCPPIRDAANREALWAALAAGDVDIVVSDHSPCTAALKEGDFATAWGGIASVQLGLPAVWTAARARGHSLADVVRWMAAAPAGLVGLSHKGRIAPGADADLVRFAPDEEFVVDVAKLHHRNPISAYAGRRLTGVVRETWLRGRPVDDTPRGRLLRRREP